MSVMVNYRGDYWVHFAYCNSIAKVKLLLRYYCDSIAINDLIVLPVIISLLLRYNNVFIYPGKKNDQLNTEEQLV